MGHYNSEYQWTITLIWTDLPLTTTELHPLKCRHIFLNNNLVSYSRKFISTTLN